jgi:ATP-dependent DNA helicase RecG
LNKSIEIVTHEYSVPISLHGKFYYRSGSTKQELTGASLNEFLLKRAGHTWDDVVETRAGFSDIDEKTVQIFLKMSEQAGRLPESESLSISELFAKLKRLAVIERHGSPRNGKWLVKL